MKKYGCILLTVLLCLFLMVPINAKAKTLNDLYSELKILSEQANKTQAEIDENKANMERTKAEVSALNSSITQINYEITNIETEINNLNTDIETKQAKISKMLNYLQFVDDESIYLEYALDANDVTDFIYRISVIEQLNSYRDNLINGIRNDIANKESYKLSLVGKRNSLNAKQTELSEKLDDLASVETNLFEISRGLIDEIVNARSVITMYEKIGCKLDDDINVCGSLKGDTTFSKPLAFGYITDEFGYRTNPISGKYEFHNALDMSSSDKENTPIYASASGKVAKTFTDNSGGNQVVIHHFINGEYYTTSYAHLKTILVQDGQDVTKNTIIGIMGTTGNSTGPHLHFSISLGRRYIDYISYSTFVSKCVDPRTIIKFPAIYKPW